VLDADIKGAFDNICHEHLLQKVGNFPSRGLIKQWLKAGYMEDDAWHPTESGTPQGGLLLCNISLHGMEEAVGVKYYNYRDGRRIAPPCTKVIIKYADDLITLCNTREDAEEAKIIISQWLAERGLEVSEEKTRIVRKKALTSLDST
jgi:RNA-directed DNA polymerase